MDNLSEQQKINLMRAAKIADNGEIAMLTEEIDVLGTKVDSATSIADKALKIAEETNKTEVVGPQGPQGDPGQDGKDGRDGENGQDGQDGKNGRDGKDGTSGKDGRDGKDGQDGKNGSPDTGAEIVKKINDLPIEDDYLIEMQHIKGLMKALEERYKATWPTGGGSSGIKQVVAGTNVTVDNSNLGYPVINATAGLTELPATGSVNSSNVTFTFTQVPTYVVADGVWLKKLDNNAGVQWSSSGLTITMVNPPSHSIFGIA